RFRSLDLHIRRFIGRTVLLAGTTAAVAGMVMAAEPVTSIGSRAVAATYVFGTMFMVCAAKAYYHIRRKEILLHREWMIRAFAVGLGVSTVRIVATPLF